MLDAVLPDELLAVNANSGSYQIEGQKIQIWFWFYVV